MNEEVRREYETRTPQNFSAWLQNRVPRCIEVVKVERGLIVRYDNGTSGFYANAVAPMEVV